LITFHSTKVTQTGPDAVEFEGDFTIRGVTKKEKLTFQVTGKGTGSGSINGVMAFDRSDESQLSSDAKWGHQSIRVTQKHYNPWVKTRQDALDRAVESATH